MTRDYKKLLYNGTTTRAARNIVREGMRAGTYFTPNKADAVRYAVARAEFEDLEPAIVIARVPINMLADDPMERGCYVNLEHIPVEYILGSETIKERR